jgi:CRISPR-associated protein Csm4
MLDEYQKSDGAPLLISSSYPYLVINDQRVPYFPVPKLPFKPHQEVEVDDTLKVKKEVMKENKKYKKRKWLDQENFEQLLNGDRFNSTSNKLERESVAMTHNAINRKHGHVLTKEFGQLFHTVEHFWLMKDKAGKPIKGGLYFLVSVQETFLPKLEACLRWLRHIGIGGDRTNGKGTFDYEVKPIEIKEPKNPNTLTNLSIYHPHDGEWPLIEQCGEGLSYRIINRNGWSGFNNVSFKKKGIHLFEEGSIFPVGKPEKGFKKHYGRLVEAEKRDDHTVWQYGFGFMLKMKL